MPDRFTISSSYFDTASWYDSSIWTDNIVPTASDRVFIRGRRYSMTGNYEYWPETRSIVTINSTVELPQSGSLYTYTDRDQQVKLDYNGTSGSFIYNVVIDKTYSAPWGEGYYEGYVDHPFPDKKGGLILNGNMAIFQPGQIVLSGSTTASVRELTIQDGGQFIIKDSSSLFVEVSTFVTGGLFKMEETASYRFNNRHKFAFDTASVNNTSHSIFYIGKSPFTNIIMDGGEVRTNTTLSADVSANDYYLSVMSSANFEVGDYVFVGEEDIQTPREDDNTQFIYSANLHGPFGYSVSSYDECFYVAGKDTGSVPNKLFIQTANGLEGTVFFTASSTELIIDENRYQVGDKVVINNEYRTITAVEDYEHLLREYDFTHPTASLTDWTTDPSLSSFYFDWYIAPGKGLTLYNNLSINQYRNIFIKDLMLDRVKIEAWIRNGVEISGSGESAPQFMDFTQPWSLNIHSDPSSDNFVTAIPTGNSPNSRTYFTINPTGSIYLTPRNSNSGDILAKAYRANITNINNLHKYTLESYKGFTKAYIDDIEVLNDVDRGGTWWGRVGLATQNNRIVCTRFKAYGKYQKITINASVVANPGDIVYETGAEYTHKTGDKVIKLCSFVTDPLDIKNKAFAYQGASEYENNGLFPYVFSTNTVANNRNNLTASRFAETLNNNNLNTITLGNGFDTNASVITYDMTTPVEFNNIGFKEVYRFLGQNFTASALSFSGSNDLNTWTPITGGIDRRLRMRGDWIRDWELSSVQSYRYIRLKMSGLTSVDIDGTNSSENILESFVLRSGSLYNFQVNNASDLDIGDRIVIIAAYQAQSQYVDRSTQYSFLVQSSSFIDTPLEDYYTIVGKSGNVLTVDKKVNFLLKKGSIVVKVNRNINFEGEYISGSAKMGKFWGSINYPAATNEFVTFTFQNTWIWKNIGFQHVTEALPVHPDNRNGLFGFFSMNHYNVHSPWRLQGCSFYNSYPRGTGWSGGQSPAVKQNMHARNNFVNFGSYLGFANTSLFTPSVNFPHIVTGNILHRQGTYGNITATTSREIVSYNFYIASAIQTAPTFTTSNVNQFYLGQNIVIKRNLLFQNSSITINTSQQPQDHTYIIEVKNNKFIGGTSNTGTNSTVIRYAVYTTEPIENQLFPARMGSDGFYITNFNPFGGILNTFAPNLGPLSNYTKNYNKWGYDIWTNRLGWYVKEQNDPWYKFYNISSSWQRGLSTLNNTNPLISATIHKTDNTTSSFFVGFDYYHDMSQYIQIQSPILNRPDTNTVYSYYDILQITGGAFPYQYTQSVQIFSSASYAGGLNMYCYKNGKLVEPIKRLIKTTDPTRFEIIYNLEGEGVYYIGLTQDSPLKGYVAFKNITSRLIGDQTSSLYMKQNGFDMRYFDGLNAQQFRNANNQYPQTNPKFRLKGAKLF
jgi:hypothetical protein